MADELCGESVRAISAAVKRSGEVSSRMLIDASLLIGGATLVAVHSWNGPPAATWQPADPEHPAAEADRNLAEALGPWRDKYPAVPVRQDAVRDHPARVLACYSSRADLVVIGRHGRGTGPAVGGIEHAVLSHAGGPVAIVPSG